MVNTKIISMYVTLTCPPEIGPDKMLDFGPDRKEIWDGLVTLYEAIKRDIILELAKYSKEHTDVSLNPDDYSKFGQEAMKYVERHF